MTAADVGAFVFSVEQEALRESVRRAGAAFVEAERVREVMTSSTGHDPGLWAALGEIGVHSLLADDLTGAGIVEAQVVAEQLGRHLAGSAYVGSAVMATVLLRELGGEVAQELLERLAAGTSVATVALAEVGATGPGRWGVDQVSTVVERTAAGHVVTGHKDLVLDLPAADVVLVVGRGEDGPAVMAVEPTAAGVQAESLRTLDATRRLGRLRLERAVGTQVGRADGVAAAVSCATQAAGAVLAAEQAGGARRALEMAVEHAAVREQFGRPIGSFQAIQHRCADLLVVVESSTSVSFAAGRAIDGGHDDADLLVSMALAYCADAYLDVAAATIQVHGGMGFTWDHPAHLFLRRARSGEVLLGSSVEHRERVLDRFLRSRTGSATGTPPPL